MRSTWPVCPLRQPLRVREKEFNKENRCERTTRAAECSQKGGRAIYRETLQALEQRRDPHECCRDYQRLRPSEVNNQRDREIGEEVVD
jgi:hypothetical protein